MLRVKALLIQDVPSNDLNVILDRAQVFFISRAEVVLDANTLPLTNKILHNVGSDEPRPTCHENGRSGWHCLRPQAGTSAPEAPRESRTNTPSLDCSKRCAWANLSCRFRTLSPTPQHAITNAPSGSVEVVRIGALESHTANLSRYCRMLRALPAKPVLRFMILAILIDP